MCVLSIFLPSTTKNGEVLIAILKPKYWEIQFRMPWWRRHGDPKIYNVNKFIVVWRIKWFDLTGPYDGTGFVVSRRSTFRCSYCQGYLDVSWYLHNISNSFLSNRDTQMTKHITNKASRSWIITAIFILIFVKIYINLMLRGMGLHSQFFHDLICGLTQLYRIPSKYTLHKWFLSQTLVKKTL